MKQLTILFGDALTQVNASKTVTLKTQDETETPFIIHRAPGSGQWTATCPFSGKNIVQSKTQKDCIAQATFRLSKVTLDRYIRLIKEAKMMKEITELNSEFIPSDSYILSVVKAPAPMTPIRLIEKISKHLEEKPDTKKIWVKDAEQLQVVKSYLSVRCQALLDAGADRVQFIKVVLK